MSRPDIPILMYHHIGQPGTELERDFFVSEEMLNWQMEYLALHGYRPMTVRDVTAQTHFSPSDRPVVITFDDAYESVHVGGAPILGRYGFTATVFVITSCVGSVNTWGSGLHRIMSAGQLLELQGKGWELGAHTCTHPHLLTVTREVQQQEITDSKRDLERIAGRPAVSFAYPYNEWDAGVREFVMWSGFTSACAVSARTPSVFADPHALRRVYVKGSDSKLDFVRKISRWYLRYRGWRGR